MEDELRQQLRELVAEADAREAAIVPPRWPDDESDGADPERPDDPDGADDADSVTGIGLRAGGVVIRPLGAGAVLRVFFWPDRARDLAGAGAAIERGIRTLRACFRRWGGTEWPAVSFTLELETENDRVMERIESFLGALASIQNAAGVVVTLRGRVLARSGTLDPMDEAQIPFLLARIDLETAKSRGKSSHAELHSEQMYAVSFWYGACLIAFFSGPYSIDFFRFRCRMVVRELAVLLPLLDDPPPAAAKRSPRPE